MRMFDLSRWSEIEALLDQALDLPTERRESWLSELARSEPDIAAQVAELLSERDALDARDFMAGSPLVAMGVPAEAPSMAGTTIGPYTIERLLGRGGMGEVWLASRSDGRFEGHCAIKFLDSSLSQRTLARRFRQEGRLLARLTHTNIARLIDAGATDDDRPFLVLEYVDGERIDRYCESMALDLKARVRLFCDVVAAVAHAHSRLIVHRDLKPSNVLVTREGVVKLLDFGVAKLLSAPERQDEAPLTRAEEVALTPEYAAPEQLAGETPSTASDVYQLGMLLYVLLTGDHPLLLEGTRTDRVKAALNGRIPRASEFAGGARRKELRGDLDAILAMALQPQPSQRYPTAAAFAEELGRYLNGEPVSARRTAPFYRAYKFASRHRWAVIASTAAVAGLCATSIFALVQAQRAEIARDRAVALAGRNEAVTEFMGRVIAEAAESKQSVTVSEMLARSEQLALRNTSTSVENRAAVLAMIADRYDQIDDAEHASKLLESALALLKSSPDHAMRSRLQCRLAVTNAGLENSDAAIGIISRELDGLAHDPDTAGYCLLDLARIHENKQESEEVLRTANLGLTRVHEAANPSGTLEAALLGTMGFGYHLSARNLEAESYFKQALAKYSELGAEHSDGALTVLNDWAVALHSAGVPRRALELYERIEKVEREREPGNEPTTTTVGNRALALLALGRFEEAHEALDLECRLAKEREDQFSEAHCVVGLVSYAIQTRSLDQAAEYLARSERLLEPLAPPGSPPRIVQSVLRGKFELVQGHIDAARAQFDSAQMSGRASQMTIYRELDIAEMKLMEQKPLDAAVNARAAVEIAGALQGDLPYSVHTGLAWLMLSRADQALKSRTQAREAVEQAIANLSHTVEANHPELVRARQLSSTL